MFKFVRLRLPQISQIILKPHRRQINLTVSVAVKKFIDSENDYASAVLHNVKLKERINDVGVYFHEEAADMASILETSETWCNDAPERVLLLLKYVITSIKDCQNEAMTIQNTRFENFVRTFAKNVSKFNDDQLSQALNLLADLGEMKSIYEPNFLSLWTALDSECLVRVRDWNVDKLLYFADQWYPLRLAKQCRFVDKAIWKISNKLRKLPPKQLVKTVFYINLTRVPVENMMDIEVNFSQNFDAFNIDDIAILCMGFFKTETPVRSSELLEKIYAKLTDHLATVEDIGLTAILKLLRYSSRIPNVSSMQNLLNALVPEIPRLSNLACLHIALLGSDTHVCHQPSLELIVEKYLRDITSLRLKDMERIAFVLAHGSVTLSDSRDSRLCHAILADLPNRVTEIAQYPKCYISLLHFLTMRHVYDNFLISAAFERKFLQLAYSKNIGGAGREAVSLDAFAAINLCGVYDGNRFPANAFQLVCKMTQDYLPNPRYRLTKSDRMLLDIEATFYVLHSKHGRIMHLLPHFQRPDILFCFDGRTGTVVPLDDLLPEDAVKTHDIRTRESILRELSKEAHLRLVAIVVGSWNCYIRDTKRRTGGFAMKLEQLRKLNYETIEIPWYEWPYSRDDMQKYLAAKLSPILSSARGHSELHPPLN
ncbi:uncharacterized protein LOC128729015 [Anopheles nili]|uniref:uncharacterized protein LOC128729015 n=1 Tax=Anopheles nili TaxID=185578 RepID=UPI00237BFE9D|nr:uncharacterized protein LOC128729015 [Anopheles nili]